ncbi:hypothetical protein V8E36_000115 [Tilletia maclaganii]
MARREREPGGRELPQRLLTYGEDPGCSSSSHSHSNRAGEGVEYIRRAETSSTPSSVDAPFLEGPLRTNSRRTQAPRRSRQHRPPSLDLKCAPSSNASDSEPGSASGLDLRLASAVGWEKRSHSHSSSATSTEFSHSWLPPTSPIEKLSRVLSPTFGSLHVPPPITITPSLHVLLQTASYRDLAFIGIPAAILSILTGLIPPALTHILREAFNAFAIFNPTGLPVTSIPDGAKADLKRSIGTVFWQLGALAAAAVLLNFLAASVWTWLGERTASRARMECYEAVSAKDIAWFDKGTGTAEEKGRSGSAGMATTFSRDADDIRSAFASSMPSLVRTWAAVIAAIAIAFKNSWKLTLVTLAAIPVAAVLSFVCERASGSLIQAERDALSEASRVIQQALSAITTVKAFNGQATENERLRKVLERSTQAWNRTSLVWSMRAGLSSSLMLAMFVQGFWYGSYLVQTGQATAGLVMTVFWSCLLITNSIEQALRALHPLQKGKIAAASIQTMCVIQPGTTFHRAGKVDPAPPAPLWRRALGSRAVPRPRTPRATVMPIDAIPHVGSPASPESAKVSPDQQSSRLTTSPRNRKRSNSNRVNAMRKVRPSSVCAGEISFRSVAFAYPSRPSALALLNVDLFIPAGETTFIVGSSGSGKSTIATLLLRLYKPLSGEIFIDNHSLSFLDPHWCLENILVLSQSPVIFDMSIHDNIAIGKTARAKLTGAVDLKTGIPTVSREDVIVASRTALLHEFVITLPDRYDTVLGNKGLSLSTGQKQRLAIARARLCDPTILVLDESTSALDQSARMLVHEAVRQWRSRSTTVIITHDLSQIGPDDYTYVMEQGRVVEGGFRRQIERVHGGRLRALLKAQAQELSPIKIIPDHVGDETPTSPTGLEAQALLSLSQILSEDACAYQAPRRQSVAVQAVRTFSLRPTTLALTEQQAEEKLPALKGSLPRHWLSRVRSDESRDHFKSEADFLDRTGQVAAMGRRLNRKDAATGTSMVNTDAAAALKRRHSDSRPLLSDTFRAAWHHQPRKGMTALGLLACLASGCTMPIFSYFLAQLLSTMAAQNQSAKVLRFALLTMLLAALDGLCAFARQWLMEIVAELWIRRLREEAFGRVLRQDLEWFDQQAHQPEKVSHCLVRDGEDARDLVGQIWGQVLAIFAMVIVASLWALIVGWQLTLVGLAVVPVFGIVIFLQNAALAKVEAVHKAHRDSVTKRFFDMMANIRAIRSMALDQVFLCRFDEADRLTSRSGLKSGPLVGLGIGLAEGLTYLAEGILFYAGAVWIAEGHYTFERVIVVFNLMVFAATYSSQMLTNLPGVSKSVTAANSLGRLAHLSIETSEAFGTARARLDGAVEFEDVVFQYPGRPDVRVLKGVSFKIQPGETVAIVGASGIGKSTIASLLQRLYEPSSGTIKIAGCPINQLEVDWLREHLTVVSQSSALFDLSVFDNIVYGENGFPTQLTAKGGEKLSDRQLRAQMAAGWAQIDKTIRKLPGGYETTLGEDGSQLSGGQAQRVGIARALMREHARILILDEFTSALDRARQAELIDLLVLRRKALGGAMMMMGASGRGPLSPPWFLHHEVSALVVTHSLEVMQRCDRILVLAGGRIVQDGSYAQLIATEGEFATLARGGEWAGGKG